MKIALVENYFPDFIISRKDFIDFLGDEHEVISFVPEFEKSSNYCLDNYKILNYKLNRKDKGVWQSIRLFFYFFDKFRKGKFDLVHTYRLHPNIIATIAAKIAGVKKIINHVTGLGVVFSKKSFKNIIFQNITFLVYQIIFLLSDKVIFQNMDDLSLFKSKLFFVSHKFHLIESSGVNLDKFNLNNSNSDELVSLKKELKVEGKKIITCISRLIPEKGINELYKASNQFGEDVHFFWIGSVDSDNPSRVGQLLNTNNFTFLGKRSDIFNLLAITDVFILPTYYREGVPRAILEAMAMKIPIVTTNTPGCNRTVENGVNGFLINPRSSEEIVDKIKNLLVMDLNVMGGESRKIVEKRFSSKIVFSRIKEHYI